METAIDAGPGLRFRNNVCGHQLREDNPRFEGTGVCGAYLRSVGANVGLALSRAKERVSGGGHHIPDATVERRYTRSIQNFLSRYRELADSWMFFDNSGTVPTVIAEENQGKLSIIDQGAYDSLVAL